MSRSAYKAVWNQLSTTRQMAIAHVIGNVAEPEIRRAAEDTKHWLHVSVGIKPDDVVLEIGCGIGRVGEVLAPLCKEWIGCDVSPNMLGHARERLSSMGNVRFVELSGFDLQPIASASVDLVYCTVVFMHLDEWDRYNYILEACRVLRSGGRLFVDNFNVASDEGWSIFEAHRRIPPQYRPPHIARFSTTNELRTYLERARGFRDIQVKENGAWIQAFAVRSHETAEPALLNDAGTGQPDSGRVVSPFERLKRIIKRALTKLLWRMKY